MDKNCTSCKFWKQVTDYENIINSGECNEVHEKMYIDVRGDGWLDSIEIEGDFCCSLYQEK